MAVYILRLSRPLGNWRHEAQYYVGYAESIAHIPARLAAHRAKRGAKMTAAAIERGIALELVAVIPLADRAGERRIKNQKNHRRFLERLQAGRVRGELGLWF